MLSIIWVVTTKVIMKSEIKLIIFRHLIQKIYFNQFNITLIIRILWIILKVTNNHNIQRDS